MKRTHMNTVPIAAGTQITLSMIVTDVEGIDGMSVQYSVNGESWSNWMPYVSTMNIEVSADYVEYILVKFRDSGGLISPIFSTGIELDVSPSIEHYNIYLPLVIRW